MEKAKNGRVLLEQTSLQIKRLFGKDCDSIEKTVYGTFRELLHSQELNLDSEEAASAAANFIAHRFELGHFPDGATGALSLYCLQRSELETD